MKIDYAKLFTLRSDGRYQGYWHELVRGEPTGKRHTICDKDPKRLFERIMEKETPKPVLFRNVAEKWWEDHVERDLVRGSQKAYYAPFNFVLSEIGDLPICDVDASEVNRVLLLEKLHGKSKKHASTVRSIIKQVFDYAIINKLVSINPVTFVGVPPGLKQEKREAPEEDLIVKIQAHLDKPFGNFVALLLYTGLRTEEAVALTWGDVKKDCILVKDAVELHGKPVLKDTKTEAGFRKVPLIEPLKPFLKRPADAEDDDYIFANDGELLSRGRIRTLWLNWCKDAGLAYQTVSENRHRGKRKCTRTEWHPMVTPHQLRHNFATVLYEAHVDELATKTIMGHKDIQTTRKIYTSVRSKHLNREIAKIADGF